jgi:hypothetical protein
LLRAPVAGGGICGNDAVEVVHSTAMRDGVKPIDRYLPKA